MTLSFREFWFPTSREKTHRFDYEGGGGKGEGCELSGLLPDMLHCMLIKICMIRKKN